MASFRGVVMDPSSYEGHGPYMHSSNTHFSYSDSQNNNYNDSHGPYSHSSNSHLSYSDSQNNNYNDSQWQMNPYQEHMSYDQHPVMYQQNTTPHNTGQWNEHNVDLSTGNEASTSTAGIESLPTPKSLGWHKMDMQEILKSYKLMVPWKNPKRPYFELINAPNAPNATPQIVFLEEQRSRETGKSFCMYPNCSTSSPFYRPADLERHYLQIHIPRKENYLCDRQNCYRGQPFARKDHFRDHLRDFHKEDLGVVKIKKGWSVEQRQQRQTEWQQERVISSRYWRCTKCLIKVFVAKSGWNCTSCHTPCEKGRKDARVALASKEEKEPKKTQTCEICSKSLVPPDYGTGEDQIYKCPACADALIPYDEYEYSEDFDGEYVYSEDLAMYDVDAEYQS